VKYSEDAFFVGLELALIISIVFALF